MQLGENVQKGDNLQKGDFVHHWYLNHVGFYVA